MLDEVHKPPTNPLLSLASTEFIKHSVARFHQTDYKQ